MGAVNVSTEMNPIAPAIRAERGAFQGLMKKTAIDYAGKRGRLLCQELLIRGVVIGCLVLGSQGTQMRNSFVYAYILPAEPHSFIVRSYHSDIIIKDYANRMRVTPGRPGRLDE